MKPKILVVDDNEEHLSFIEMALEAIDCQAVGASSVDQALSCIEKDSYLAAVIDFSLNDRMTGIDLCRKLKESPSTANMPVIIISAERAEESLVHKAFDASAVDFIQKPFKAIELQARLQARLRAASEKNIFPLVAAANNQANNELTFKLALGSCGELLDSVEKKIRKDLNGAMDELCLGLRNIRLLVGSDGLDQIAALCIKHPLKGIVHQDPFTFRAFSKPRGYAGDSEMMDYVYSVSDGASLPDGVSEMGRGIFEYTTGRPGEGVRARRKLIVKILDRLAVDVEKPKVLSVAAGHLTEAALSKGVKSKKMGRFVALDLDKESLAQIGLFYGAYGVEPMHADIRKLITGKLDVGRFDFIYSLGLYDYLEQRVAQRVTEGLFNMLEPGGKLIIANFLPGIPFVGYMETFMDWKLIYRNPEQMLGLAKNIPANAYRDLRISIEENNSIIFLQVSKTHYKSDWLGFSS